MKYLYISLGFLSLVLGIIGIYLPVLPTTPFLLLSAALFGKGSDKFHMWFINTKLYKDNIEAIKSKDGMGKKAKTKTLLMVTCLVILSFIFMKNIYGRITLLIVLLGHYYYFLFRVKTNKELN
ncbi:MAG: YbaN family protein [Peptoniphilaceae bacterium]